MIYFSGTCCHLDRCMLPTFRRRCDAANTKQNKKRVRLISRNYWMLKFRTENKSLATKKSSAAASLKTFLSLGRSATHSCEYFAFSSLNCFASREEQKLVLSGSGFRSNFRAPPHPHSLTGSWQNKVWHKANFWPGFAWPRPRPRELWGSR